MCDVRPSPGLGAWPACGAHVVAVGPATLGRGRQLQPPDTPPFDQPCYTQAFLRLWSAARPQADTH
jgi:hypothetical protein